MSLLSAWMYYSERTQKAVIIIVSNEIMKEMERASNRVNEFNRENKP